MNARPLAILAVLLGLISLSLNFYLVSKLRNPEPLIRSALERAGGEVRLEGGMLHYTVRIPEGTPFAADIPLDESVNVAVDTVIPIRTTVRLPLPAPFENRVIPVPLRANVPLRATVPVQISDTVELRIQTDREIAIPLQIRFRDDISQD